MIPTYDMLMNVYVASWIFILKTKDLFTLGKLILLYKRSFRDNLNGLLF